MSFCDVPLTESEEKELAIHLLKMRLAKLSAKAITHISRFYIEAQRKEPTQ